jgi:hypothetical protein
MIEFNEETHTYKINGDDSYRSVTTVLATWFKPFDPHAAILNLRKRPSKYDGCTDDEILLQWEHTRDTAAMLGTRMHANIEAYMKGDPVDDTSVEFSYFLEFIKDKTFQSFGIEHRVFDESTKLVGTIDYVAQNADGTVDVYDWKRSGDLTKGFGKCIHPLLGHIPDTKYWRYTLQLNMYRFLLEKNGQSVRNMYIACFHPSNLSHQVYRVPHVELPVL